MAVLSPALALAMCVMFVITRLHRHFYLFERPLLFGLHYCLEPDRDQLAALVKATSAQKGPNPTQGKKKGKPASSSKPKISVASLSVRRATLMETFFSTEAEFPHHNGLAHLMAICCGYFTAYLFEDGLSCFFPGLLANRRSGYVGILTVGFATFEAWRISVTLTSTRVMLAFTCIAWILAMFLLSAGDFANFIKFDQAFTGLRTSVTEVLTSRFGVEENVADGYGRIITISARFIIAIAAAFIGASFAAPARRFSRLDYEMHRQYRRNEADERDDPYSLARPRPVTMLVIALDYVLSLLAVFLWCTSPRGDVYGSWRIYFILACVVVRFAGLRIRLQRYLDSAIDAYRKFWTEKSSLSLAEAGRNVSLQVIGISFYLIMIAMAYLTPAVVPLVLSAMAKLDGGIASGLCPVKNSIPPSPFQSFTRESAAFLAWWSIAAYALFGYISLFAEAAMDFLEPGSRDHIGKLPVPTSGSERRKQKRLMQEQLAGSHSGHRP